MNLARANVVLAIGALALAVPTVLQFRSEAETFTDAGRIPRLFEGFTADNVGVVVLAQPKKDQPPAEPAPPNQPNAKKPVAYDTLQFVRTEKGWALGPSHGERAGAPVDKTRVESMVFKHLADIRFDQKALVRENATPEQLAELGLDEAQATVVQCKDRNGVANLVELLVGKELSTQYTAESVRGVYVRNSGSTDVIAYEVPFWQRDVKPDTWLDKVVLRVEPEKVKSFAVKSAVHGELVFERKEGAASWTCPSPPPGAGAVRQSEVEGLVQRLRWVSCQDYVRPAQTADRKVLGLEPPQLELRVTWRDGDQEKSVVLSSGNQVEGKNEHWLLASDSPFLMTWPATMAPSFERAPKEYFDPSAPPVNDPPKDDGAPKDEPRTEQPKKDEEQKPAEEKPAEEKPAGERPAGEKPAGEKTGEKPAEKPPPKEGEKPPEKQEEKKEGGGEKTGG